MPKISLRTQIYPNTITQKDAANVITTFQDQNLLVRMLFSGFGSGDDHNAPASTHSWDCYFWDEYGAQLDQPYTNRPVFNQSQRNDERFAHVPVDGRDIRINRDRKQYYSVEQKQWIDRKITGKRGRDKPTKTTAKAVSATLLFPGLQIKLCRGISPKTGISATDQDNGFDSSSKSFPNLQIGLLMSANPSYGGHVVRACETDAYARRLPWIGGQKVVGHAMSKNGGPGKVDLITFRELQTKLGSHDKTQAFPHNDCRFKATKNSVVGLLIPDDTLQAEINGIFRKLDWLRKHHQDLPLFKQTADHKFLQEFTLQQQWLTLFYASKSDLAVRLWDMPLALMAINRGTIDACCSAVGDVQKDEFLSFVLRAYGFQYAGAINLDDPNLLLQVINNGNSLDAMWALLTIDCAMDDRCLSALLPHLMQLIPLLDGAKQSFLKQKYQSLCQSNISAVTKQVNDPLLLQALLSVYDYSNTDIAGCKLENPKLLQQVVESGDINISILLIRLGVALSFENLDKLRIHLPTVEAKLSREELATFYRHAITKLYPGRKEIKIFFHDRNLEMLSDDERQLINSAGSASCPASDYLQQLLLSGFVPSEQLNQVHMQYLLELSRENKLSAETFNCVTEQLITSYNLQSTSAALTQATIAIFSEKIVQQLNELYLETTSLSPKLPTVFRSAFSGHKTPAMKQNLQANISDIFRVVVALNISVTSLAPLTPNQIFTQADPTTLKNWLTSIINQQKTTELKAYCQTHTLASLVGFINDFSYEFPLHNQQNLNAFISVLEHLMTQMPDKKRLLASNSVKAKLNQLITQLRQYQPPGNDNSASIKTTIINLKSKKGCEFKPALEQLQRSLLQNVKNSVLCLGTVTDDDTRVLAPLAYDVATVNQTDLKGKRQVGYDHFKHQAQQAHDELSFAQQQLRVYVIANSIPINTLLASLTRGHGYELAQSARGQVKNRMVFAPQVKLLLNQVEIPLSVISPVAPNLRRGRYDNHADRTQFLGINDVLNLKAFRQAIQNMWRLAIYAIKQQYPEQTVHIVSPLIGAGAYLKGVTNNETKQQVCEEIVNGLVVAMDEQHADNITVHFCVPINSTELEHSNADILEQKQKTGKLITPTHGRITLSNDDLFALIANLRGLEIPTVLVNPSSDHVSGGGAFTDEYSFYASSYATNICRTNQPAPANYSALALEEQICHYTNLAYMFVAEMNPHFVVENIHPVIIDSKTGAISPDEEAKRELGDASSRITTVLDGMRPSQTSLSMFASSAAAAAAASPAKDKENISTTHPDEKLLNELHVEIRRVKSSFLANEFFYKFLISIRIATAVNKALKIRTLLGIYGIALVNKNILGQETNPIPFYRASIGPTETWCKLIIVIQDKLKKQLLQTANRSGLDNNDMICIDRLFNETLRKPFSIPSNLNPNHTFTSTRDWADLCKKYSLNTNTNSTSAAISHGLSL